MSKFKAGMIIKNAAGKRKILGQCGEVFFVSAINYFEIAVSGIYTEEELLKFNFKPTEEPWKPELNREYVYIDSCSHERLDRWDNGIVDNYRLSVGNVFPPENNKELIAEYKRKLQEMFKK